MIWSSFTKQKICRFVIFSLALPCLLAFAFSDYLIVALTKAVFGATSPTSWGGGPILLALAYVCLNFFSFSYGVAQLFRRKS